MRTLNPYQIHKGDFSILQTSLCIKGKFLQYNQRLMNIDLQKICLICFLNVYDVYVYPELWPPKAFTKNCYYLNIQSLFLGQPKCSLSVVFSPRSWLYTTKCKDDYLHNNLWWNWNRCSSSFQKTADSSMSQEHRLEQ